MSDHQRKTDKNNTTVPIIEREKKGAKAVNEKSNVDDGNKATGSIPRLYYSQQQHDMEMLEKTKEIYEKCSEILTAVKSQTETLVETVKTAIDEKVNKANNEKTLKSSSSSSQVDSDQQSSQKMTTAKFTEIMDNFKKDFLTEQKKQFDKFRIEVLNDLNKTTTRTNDDVGATTTSSTCTSAQQQQQTVQAVSNSLSPNFTQQSHDVGPGIYSYNGAFFNVPQDFEFPTKVSLKSGISFWFRGMTIGDDNNNYNNQERNNNNNNGNNFLVVKPFRELTSKSFPTTKLKNDFKLHWVGCFKTLENSGIDLPPRRKVLVGNVVSHPYQNNNEIENGNDVITQEELDRIYNEFIAFLKQRFTYCFAKKKTARARDCLTSWTIATWANKMQRSQVMKFGSESDKSYLPPPTSNNKSNNRNKSRKRKQNSTTNNNNEDASLCLNHQKKRQNTNDNR